MKRARLLQRRAGLTIIELLIVLLFLAELARIAAPSFIDLLDRQRVQAVAAELSTDIAYARSQAGLRRSDLSPDFNRNAQMSCYSIVANLVLGGCDCRLGQGQACPLVQASADTRTELETRQIQASSGVSLSLSSASKDLPGGIGNSMRFRAPQLTLAPADGRILVRGRKARLEVHANALGRVHTCAPAGVAAEDYPSCDTP